jgi:hypothetical protein
VLCEIDDITVRRWRELMVLYGEWLQSRGNHREAAVAYITCHQWTKAVSCYREGTKLCHFIHSSHQLHQPNHTHTFEKTPLVSTSSLHECHEYSWNERIAGEWRSAFVTAASLKLSSSDIHKLASEVVVSLINSSRYLEAAHATMDYLKDLEQAVLLLVRGEEWAECVRLVHIVSCFLPISYLLLIYMMVEWHLGPFTWAS